MEYYNKPEKEVLSGLNTSPEGLSSKDAKKRLAKYGPNELEDKKKISPIKIFLSQFRNFIVYILVAAIIVSLLTKQALDAIVIAIILFLNAILGFIQEYKAERAIEAIKKFISLSARVIRDRKEIVIKAKDLVPGDIIILEDGSKVPADARLLEAYTLKADESALTGESVPVKKEICTPANKLQIAEQKNMVFSSTNITSGKGKAVITATGSSTEIGKIASLIQETEKELTPLQKQLKALSKQLSIITISICLMIFLLVFLKGGSITESFLVGVALAVAAIPEGLPAIVTISLALGTKRMVKKNVLIKKLPSVETLGSTTVICADKTGTLTLNRMTVTRMYVNKSIMSAKGILKKDSHVELLLKIGALCNNAALSKDSFVGDPTETALLSVADKIRIRKDILLKKYPRIHEIPFSSERKLMSVINKVDSKNIMFTKGAPDIILGKCSKIYLNNKVVPLTKKLKSSILDANNSFAKDALRVLGFAYKYVSGKDNDENNLVFVGLQGMIDPPREDAKEAIKKCNTAGIKVVMITGDHRLTAEAIARELGITGKSIDGNELDTIKDLSKIVDGISIYARVDPLHKLKIVDALKKKKHVVAMTGDGVNDAPALKRADIGIAVGSGTDVSKEAADMVLTDDNFASIVSAVEEGRGIYSNIVKFVSYLLSSNIGEILAILISLLIGLPLPLIALQILWINLVTDGLPALALGVDNLEGGIMKNKPRKISDNILNKKRIFMILLIGLTFSIGTVILYKYNLSKGYVYATTVAFTTIVLYELFNVFNFRSETSSLLKVNHLRNKYLLLAVLSSLAAQLAVVYTPLSNVFNTTRLPFSAWPSIILVSSSVIIVSEAYKLITRKSNSIKA